MCCLRPRLLARRILLISVICLGYSTRALGQTFIEKLGANAIPADPDGVATPDFFSLTSFVTPVGATPEIAIARLVVPSPATDLKFQIVPPVAAATCTDTNGRCPVQVDVGGGVATIKESNTINNIADVFAEVPSSPPATSSGFEIVDVVVDFGYGYNFPAAETWSVKILQLAAEREYSGFIHRGPVEATVKAAVTRPKIVVDSGGVPPDVLDFGAIQTSLPDVQTPVKSYSIRNVGTGTLTLSGSLIPPAPFSIVAGTIVPASLQPMQTQSIPIKFRPTATGSSGNAVTVSITSDDPGSPTSPIALRGTGITLDAVLLLDLSDSMNYFPDSSASAPEEEARLWHAKQAAGELFEEYGDLTGGQARFGLYGFSDPGVPSPSAIRVVDIGKSSTIAGLVHTALSHKPTGLSAGNGTPMAEGIKLAQTDLNLGTDTTRSIILLLSDGAHNEDSVDPPDKPKPLHWVQTLKSKKIRVYSVAFGQNIEVDHDLLDQLANDTDGEPLPANPTDFDALKKSFRGALREWLGLSDLADPTSTITAGQRKSHTVCVDDQAYSVAFILDWNISQDDAVSLTIETPTGQVLNPGSPGVKFHKSRTYAMYVVTGDLVRGGHGAGLWTLRLTGSTSLSTPLTYSYNAQAQSFVYMKPKFSRGVLQTARDHLMEVAVEGAGVALRPDKISVSYDSPAQSWGTYLSTQKVDPALILGRGDIRTPGIRGVAANDEGGGVPDVIMGEPATRIQKKAYVLQHLTGTPFENKRSQGSMDLFDDGSHGDKVARDGIYSNVTTDLKHDGIYKFAVDLEAAQSPRGCIQRHMVFDKYVGVQLSAAAMEKATAWKDVELTPFFDPDLARQLNQPAPKGFARKAVMFTPKDELGNYWGPGHADQITVGVQNGEQLGSIVDNLDGSYVQVVQYKKGVTPVANVSARGVASAPVRLRQRCWLLRLFGCD